MDFVEYVKRIRGAILARYGCVAYCLSTQRVELGDERADWSGDVERLSMQDCSAAAECYAWEVRMPDGTPYMLTVLKRGRVTSPELAVLSYLLRNGNPESPRPVEK